VTAPPDAKRTELRNSPTHGGGERKRERERERERERKRDGHGNETVARTTRRETTARCRPVTWAPEIFGTLPRKNHARCREHCCYHVDKRPGPCFVVDTASADARTTRNVTRENPPRRPVRNVRKPRNYDINTHRRPPPPLGHEQYGVPPGLAAGKPTGWQE